MTATQWVCRHGCVYTGETVAHNMDAHREEYQQRRVNTDRVEVRRTYLGELYPDLWYWQRLHPDGQVISRGLHAYDSADEAREDAARLNGKPFLLEVYR